MTDFTTWLLDYGYDRIFRILVYKRVFTPYEQKNAFMDETQYVDNHMQTIKIREVFELPDGDVMIGYQEIFEREDLDTENPTIHYKKLSEIELSYYPQDMSEEEWE